MKPFYFMVVPLPLIISLNISQNDRNTRDVSNGKLSFLISGFILLRFFFPDQLEYSYQLGPGGYASFSLPSLSSSHSSESSSKIQRSMTPVPVFLNNPLYKSKPRLQIMSDRESLDHSQEGVTTALSSHD